MITPGPNRIGSAIRFKATFKDDINAYVDPSTVAVKLKSPSAVTTPYTYPTSSETGRASIGQYFLDFAPTEGGRWYIRWEATIGTTPIVLEDDFIVQASPFIPQPAANLGDYA